LQLQNDYRQREHELFRRVDAISKHNEQLRTQLVIIEANYDELRTENQTLQDEVCRMCSSFVDRQSTMRLFR
jgi:predicted nuclease with TOPRIM domain